VTAEGEGELHSAQLDPLYVFQSLREDSPIRAYHHLPELFAAPSLNITIRNVQFYVGARHSGAPVHFHRHAWNGLVFGRKRWMLFPPRASFYSKKHVHRWVRDHLPAHQQQVLECEQRSGDIVYVPDYWAHGVLNLDASVGFASEFLWGNTYFNM
jgi:Cupin-like domain